MLKKRSRQGGHKLRKPMPKHERLPRKLKLQGKKLLKNKERKFFEPILLLKIKRRNKLKRDNKRNLKMAKIKFLKKTQFRMINLNQKPSKPKKLN